MAPPTRLTQTLCALTTQLFRCRGLAPTPPGAERFNRRELLFWALFIALGAGWYFLHWGPVRERNAMLSGRLTVLEAQRRAEELQLARVRRESLTLERGWPDAWERAARARLGWLKPGEAVNLSAWLRAHPGWDPGNCSAARSIAEATRTCAPRTRAAAAAPSSSRAPRTRAAAAAPSSSRAPRTRAAAASPAASHTARAGAQRTARPAGPVVAVAPGRGPER
jgi:hypothetical protein